VDGLGWLLAVAAGAAAGTLGGLVPGLHPNLVVAWMPLAARSDLAFACGLAALVGAHAFSSLLASTYVGIPGGDGALTVLPAHRMVRSGRGREAVGVAADAALAGLAAGVLLILPLKWMVGEPGRLGDLRPETVRLLAAAVLGWLLLQELRGGGRAIAGAALAQAVAGACGLLAFSLHLQGLGGRPGHATLPLLGGLFGAATLAESLASRGRLPPQEPPRPPEPRMALRLGGCALGGAAASLWTALIPGVTASAAATTVPAALRTDDPRPALATLAAIGTAHEALAVGLLWAGGRARSGLAVGMDGVASPWEAGVPPGPLLEVAAALLAGGLAGHVAVRRLDGWAAPRLDRIPGQALAAGAAALAATVVLAVTGLPGLLLWAGCAAAGLVPLALGVRRVHLTAALLVPLILG
jgi:putative membrane protein